MPDAPPSLSSLCQAFDAPRSGAEAHALAARLYPICRSITGDGVRQTLAVLNERIPLQIHEVPSGTPALDWTVPDEWNPRAAWIKDPDGRTVVDFQNHNLHLVNYSQPIHQTLSLDELAPHLHSLPDHPDWIPYRTSYYAPAWGFCLPHSLRQSLQPGPYEVFIDANLRPGHLTYAEHVLPGATDEEVLLSVHLCHPSLANDNLSGIAIAAQLAERLAALPRRLTYRFLFIPGTIGSIVWLSRNPDCAARVRHGLVLSCLGDPGAPTYKKSRRANAPIDRAVALALRDRDAPHEILDFSPYGYDERQYGSPGFNLPVGLLTRSQHGTYPQYHTSADNLDFIRPEALADSLLLLLRTLEILEGDATYLNLLPCGEPQLGRRGLYDSIGGANERHQRQMALLWVLNQSDGDHSLLDVADRSGLPFPRIREAADRLLDAHLLAPVKRGAP
jgi:aminopeptidase-like protein